MATEQRALKTTCEVRQGTTGPMISGYAAIFNRRSADMGFVEQVDPAAFNKTLKDNPDVRAFFNHDPNLILGRASNGTLRVSTDAIGLRYEIDINPADPDGQRALAKVERGDIDGSSFTFNMIRDAWDWTSTPPERRLLEVSLSELGPVTMPAYPDTSAAARRALSPIADRVHKPVEELVAALGTGEIRSLLADLEEPVGEQRAVWSTAMVNNLPDSAFLYVESGGKKDSDGKTTPRTLRHFPYKDASGKVDLPHLRNALARIPQSSLPDSVKSSLTAKAQKILSATTDAKSLTGLEETTTMDEIIEEARAGKVLSAKSVAHIQGVMDQLRDLLDVAKSESPADSEIDLEDEGDGDQDDEMESNELMGRSLDALTRDLELRGRVYA